MISNEHIGFNFLEAALPTMAAIVRRHVASPATLPDPSMTVKASLGSVTPMTIHHGVMADHVFPLAIGQS